MTSALAFRRMLARGVLLCAVAAACAKSPAATSVTPATGELAPAERTAVFERIWTDVGEKFYDPRMNGADWPAAHLQYRAIVDTISTDRSFYAAMNRMLGLLHDAHTRVRTPAAVAQQAREEAANVGLTVRELDGKPTVVAVRAGSPAALAGIEPGMLVPSVNGVNTLTRVATVSATATSFGVSGSTSWRIYTQVFNGQRGATMQLSVERADGSAFDAALTPEVVSAAATVDAHLLPSGTAYIEWNVFRPPVAKDVAAAVARYKDAPGMILDLRYNPGGNSSELNAIATLFLDQKTAVYQEGLRHGGAAPKPTPYYLGSKGGGVYRGPMVILLNEASGSSSELFASALQESGRAKVAGAVTCGCVIGINGSEKLTGGAQLDIGAMLFLTPHGEKLDGRGVIPDIPAASTLADLRAHRDAVLEAADQALRSTSAIRH